MSRSVDEWIGRNDDDPLPRRVRVRVFLRADGHCAMCDRRLRPGDKWTCDHRIALINGGANRESNLQVLCEWCDKPKTVFDVQQKSKTYQKRLKHIGIRPRSSRPMPGTKVSGWKHKMSGEWVRR